MADEARHDRAARPRPGQHREGARPHRRSRRNREPRGEHRDRDRRQLARERARLREPRERTGGGRPAGARLQPLRAGPACRHAIRRRRPDPVVRSRARLRVLLARALGRGRPAGRGTPAQAEAGFPTAFEQDACLIRGRIRLARDQAPLALEDSSRALELGRRAGYPDMEVPALALHARVLEAFGKDRARATAVDELFAFWPERFPTSYWVADLAFTLDELSRSQRLLEAAELARTSSRWLEAGLAVARDDLARASEAFSEDRLGPDELLARVGAARQALAAGRRREADAELSVSLPASRSHRRGPLVAGGRGAARVAEWTREPALSLSLQRTGSTRSLNSQASRSSASRKNWRRRTHWRPARPSQTAPRPTAHPERTRASPRCTPCCAAARSP